MGHHGFGHFPEEPASWDAFAQVLHLRFLPIIHQKLLTELHQLRMVNGNFSSSYSQFQAYRQQLTGIDEQSLI